MKNSKVMLSKKGEVKLEDLLSVLRSSEELRKCGAIVVFIGIVRGIGKDGSKVKLLSYEAYEEGAIRSLSKIREQVLKEVKGVREIIVNHVIDDLKVGDDTLHVLVAAEHRKEAFEAAKLVIDRLKQETPIWKKEITEKGSYWIREERFTRS
ncbi:MAG: molybdenum cofactor biosynthesis protein MoaE [Thermoproteota archaeon]|nr:MAG: molybdenum cofactor biosynthesis protein MoaE [Candidatus Korarchaeota archaeon]